MSMWMTSGASRLKAKQGQTFAARAQSRSRVMNSGRLLSSNRNVIARNPNTKRRKRIVVGEKATVENLQSSARNRPEGVSVTVRYDDNRSERSRSSYVPPNNAPQRFRRDPPPPVAAESPYYSSERVNPRQLSYRGAAPHPSVRRDDSYAVSSPYAASSITSAASRHQQDRSYDYGQVPRAFPQYHGPPASQHNAIPMGPPEHRPPPQDHNSYHYGHSYSAAPQQYQHVHEAPLETPRHDMVDEYGRPYGHVAHDPSQNLTPFQRYLRSPTRRKQHHPLASSRNVQRLPSVPEQMPSVHHQPPPFMLDEPNPQDYGESYYPDHDFYQMEEEPPAGRGLNMPPMAQQFGQHSQRGASPLNRKRLFDSSRHHQAPPGIQGGHSFASAISDGFDEFGAFDSAEDAPENPFLDRDYDGARKKPRLDEAGGDMSDFEEPNPNPLRFAFGSGNRKQNNGGGGIAKFQRPRPLNSNDAHVAPPPSSMHGYATMQSHDVPVSDSHSYQQYGGLTDYSSAPGRVSGRIGERENLPPRRQGEPIRYFDNGMEVDLLGRPLPPQGAAAEQVAGF